MSDRTKFILNTSAEFFSQTASLQHDDGSIQDFFQNEEINILAVTLMENALCFHHTVPTDENCLLFYKIPQLGIAPKSSVDQPIGILTLEGGLVKSIYNSVSRVYAPHLTKQKVDYSPEIEKLIENLHSTLGASLGLSQSGIHTVQDEVNFWNQKLSNSPTKSDKANAKAIVQLVEYLNLQIREIQSNSITPMDEFLDSIYNSLDELWRLPHAYPQNRMIDLITIISSTVVDVCTDYLDTGDMWNINSIHTTQLLSEVADIIESWIRICDTLTRLFWPNNATNPWTGNPHIPKNAQMFRDRLSEIKSIKNMFSQIVTIFSDNEQTDTIVRDMFHHFVDINILDISAFGIKRWKKAVNQFEAMLQPIDENVASLLKSKLNCHLNNPRQIIHILSQYDTVLRRPSIMNLLTPEREIFVKSLNEFIKELKTCLHQKTSYQDNVNISPICSECRWLKVVLHQINEIVKISHLIDERHGYEDLKNILNDTKKETENLLKNNFELWREASAADIKNGELSLSDDKPVVEFEREGRQLMQVTFKPKLLTFCHDVREFEYLGFRIPIELRDTATHATKFMACARRLQQIATFHNTIGDRIIPCQRPIMLKNAMELSKLVRSESVAWNDEDSASRYVAVLQNAVSNLSRDNTYLAGQHEETKKIIINLMNVNLLRHGEIWKDEMRHLREIVATLEGKGYTNLHAFKLHWDYQLYKILEYQYLQGITELNTRLPTIHIEIIFRQQKLEFRPPIQEIKFKYYSQLRNFLERPLRFRGLSDQSSKIFKAMVDRNRHRFVELYRKSEDLFAQLNDVLDVWMPWVALGQVNLDGLCDINLSSWEDWDKNFKACKHFSQQIAKIENSEDRLDCFVIDLLPLRSDIELIGKKYWETLTNTLRTSILKDISVLQDFLQSSLQVLQNIVLDETGIAEAGAKYERITSDFPKMNDLLKIVEGKDKCLAGWCKERVSALSNIVLQWEQLQPLIENHSAVLQRQINIMRDYVESQMSNLKEEAEKFHIRWESTIKDLEINETVNLQMFKDRLNTWNGLKEKRQLLTIDCSKYHIDFPIELAEIFDGIDNDMRLNGEQWEMFENFEKEFENVANEELSIYRRRPYILTDFLSKWSNIVNSDKSSASNKIQSSLESYQSALPIIQNLQSDGLTEKHWSRILNLANQSPKPYHDICLRDLLSNVPALVQNEKEIVKMVRQASSEQIIRAALTELDQWGGTATFKTTSHTDTKHGALTLIRDFQDVLNKIGDHQFLLQSAMNSTASDEFTDQANIWENRLTLLDRNLTSLNQIQRKWIYLEPIFGVGTLKNELAAFQRIDKDFRYIMREISNDPRILSIAKISNISSIIESLENQLSKCQSTLTSFILAKRKVFPRFYFLADDDLLEMLGQSSKIEIIQKHIKKIIPGVQQIGVTTTNEMNFIYKLFSAEGDEVVLKNKVEINGLVEEWLNKLVIEIRVTLMELIKTCSQTEFLKVEQIQHYPIQVLCTSKALSFTKMTEKSIASMTLQSHLKSIKGEIDQYFAMLVQATDYLIGLKIRAILIDLVHQVSVVEYLLTNNVTNLQDWAWLQQIKYYMNQNQIVIVKMVYAEFEYSYEYLGNPNKLVHTKLTHNCYLTLMQAMHLGLGGNPFGPAGTGKTECVKALGAMLGRLVLVFNCNENIDTHSIGLILSGLAQCGAWGCFDEFNRLKEETLSAISMIIQPLQTAIKEKQKTVTILEESIPLNHHCGMFVTLNPAGQDYGGRQNLPHNLQALFRPIVMQQPEPKDISKVMLFVDGFKTGDEIGNRMVELFRLAGHTLSPQRHYEWGLRELKTVIYACGKSLRHAKKVLSSDEEMELVVEALRSNTMSKLNETDSNLFDMLIEKVFPNTKKLVSTQDQLKKLIEESFAILGLESNEKQVDKCIQLYEQLEKRMGVVILGPPKSGKTTIISVLKQTLASMSKIVRTYTIAPKSMNRTQLLGKLDPDTKQWRDGVLTTTAIAVNAEQSDISSWIICDGDVDPEWIEALNSVLDDNKLLTLPSGWRIQFGDNVNFIFETHDLHNASPATISRMGIVTLSEADLNPSIIIESWLKKQSNPEIIDNLMVEFYRAIDYIENLKYKSIMLSKLGLIQCGLEFLNDCVTKEQFCVGLARGLGSTLHEVDLNGFCVNIFQSADLYVPNNEEAELCCYNAFQDRIEYFSTDHTTESDNTLKSSNALIRTGHMQMFSDVVRQFMKNSKNVPFLIIGPSGCGKSLLVQTVANEFSGSHLITINCSAQLTADSVLHSLKQNCLVISGIRGREYKPKFTKLVLYLKNLNLCYIDNYGTSDVIELLLQLIYRKGFYASDTLEWISVNDLQVGCSVTNNTEANLSPRFLAIVQLLVLNYPKEEEMHAIIKSQLISVYNQFQKDSKGSRTIAINDAVNALITVYSSISKQFISSQHSHYVFTPKMLTQLIFKLLNYPKDDFRKACISELTNTFGNRIVDGTHVQQFNEIIRGQFHEFIEIEQDSYYYLPSGTMAWSFVCVAEEEWKENVSRNVAVCCSEDVFIELPVTKNVLRLTSSICCILSQPGKNLLLCGMNGSGHYESMHIACTILHIKILSPVPVKNYKIEDFYNDLRMAMQTSALDDQVIIFHIDHAWLTYLPDIMKPIEAILEGSEIPELFGDEIETVASPLRNAVQLDGYQESLASYFWERVRNNVHLVITLETSTQGLDEIFSQYPSLYRNTEVIYLQPTRHHEFLPKTILQSLSSQQRIEIPLLKTPLKTTGDWESSPLRFNQLIKTYGHIYSNYFKNICEEKHKLQAGVQKLSSAYSVVETLKTEAQQQEIALAEKRKLANKALEMISSTMRNATDQRTDLLELKQQTQASSQKLMERKNAIEIELKDVEPILMEASAAVAQIKSEALSEIRSLRAPPEIIRDILEGVLRLMGIRDTSWNSMKSFLAKRGVKEDIRSLDPARISSENCSAVEKLLLNKATSFEQKNAKRASVAAAPLASWVIANVKYSKVVQSIKPLEREQSMLQKNLEEAEGQIKSLTSGLDDVDARVKELSGQLNMYTQEAAVLEIKLNEARNTLQAAEVLVEKLSSEYSSWNQQLDTLNRDLESLQQKAFIIALNITHLSHYIYENRMYYMTNIIKELQVKEFNVMKNIISDQDIIMWKSMGLSADVQSMENAALLSEMLKLPFNTAPIPLLTDPTGCAYTWLIEYFNSRSILHEICNQNNDRFTYTLELAVRFGKCLIVQDFQLTKPPLLAILTCEIKCRFNKRYLQVGSKLVDFHDDFRLVLVTRLSKIDVGMEVRAYVANIPFTTTVSGYTDQLMAKAIQLKQPELEEKRLQLLQNEGQLGKQKLDLQNKLLVELSSAQGDILKNELLLKTLNEVKESSNLIDTSIEESGVIRRKLMLEYDQYRLVCENAAKFFNGINRIYKITVGVFTNLFLQSISHQENFDEELSYTHLLQLCYSMLSRAIPTSDQLMLGLNICKCAYPQKIPDKEWELFITNFISSEEITQSIPPWIKKELRPKISCLLLNHPEFYETLKLDNEMLWTKYANDSKEISIPSQTITEFQKILVTQIFHPNELVAIISTTVSKLLHYNNILATKPTIQQLATESQNENPILLVASGDMDPAKEIEDYVVQKLGKNQFLEISTGKGQESSSLIALRKAASEGLWICIKNVHLVPHWLDSLSQELDVLQINKNFRLWLVCDSITNFPESLLMKCSHIKYESPSGVKNKILRLIKQWSPFMAQKRDLKYVKLYIIIFTLNSVLQERRSYIPQGWSKWYDFSESDLRAAVSVINWMEKENNYKDNWSVIRGLCQHIAFGGRIDNYHDLELLLTLLKEFFGEHVLSNNWSPLQFKISIPQSSNVLDYINAIAKLPDIESPEMFGLPASTNISKDLIFCRNLLKRLKSNYYSSDDHQNYDKRLKPILNMWKKLTLGSSVIESYNTILPKESPRTPWHSFIFSELRLAVQLFKTIHGSLVHLHTILKDNTTLQLEDAQLLQSICENVVPLKWRQIWSGSRMLTEYIKSVVTRSVEAERRFKIMMHLDFSDEIDFCKVFNIESYLAALKLINAKELGLSTCSIDLMSTLLGSIDKSNLTTPKVSSILIDGALLKNNKLVMFDRITTQSSQDYYIVPEFQINFNIAAEHLGKDIIELPLYSNSSREHFICTLNIRSSVNKEVVTLAGVALNCPD